MRMVALDVLMDVLENGAYANIALRKALSAGEPRDRAFVTELVNETLRNLRLIDGVVNHFSKLPVDKMKPIVRNVLRLTVCQLRVLTKIPPHAAVHEAVELTKKRGQAGLAGFVNGLLRNVVRKPNEPTIPPDNWVLRYSFPDKLAADVETWLGKEKAVDFAGYSHKIPSVTVFVNTLKTTPDALAARLHTEGVSCTDISGGFLALHSVGDMTELAPFKEGLFFVMDAGAITPVDALDVKPGMTLLDLCAAPGGKSFAAACKMQNRGTIYAMDIHPHRVALIKNTAKRLGITNLQTRTGDAREKQPDIPPTDAVLLDAPCSGLGTLRKRPEIKHRYKGIDPVLLTTQQVLLTAAANYVKPGGILVYSTCTVSREENDAIITRFCNTQPGFTLEKSSLLLPGPHNDGFFTARMRKGQ